MREIIQLLLIQLPYICNKQLSRDTSNSSISDALSFLPFFLFNSRYQAACSEKLHPLEANNNNRTSSPGAEIYSYARKHFRSP